MRAQFPLPSVRFARTEGFRRKLRRYLNASISMATKGIIGIVEGVSQTTPGVSSAQEIQRGVSRNLVVAAFLGSKGCAEVTRYEGHKIAGQGYYEPGT